MANYLTLHKTQGAQALKDIFVQPLSNLLTILVIAFSLALPTTLYVITKNVMLVTEEWRTPNILTVYLDNISERRIKSLENVIANWSEVDSVTYVSPDEGLGELKKIQGFKDAVHLLESNPLPAVLLITPRTDDSNIAQDLASKLRQEKGVEEVRFDSDWLQRLAAIEKLVYTLTWLFSGLMLVAVVLIISNTLRLQVHNNREEIQVMKLVGATDSFILRPYLYTGMWFSLCGALVAYLITLCIVILLGSAAENFDTLYNSEFTLGGLRIDEVLILFMLSGLLGHLAARLAVTKHLRAIEPV